MKYKTRFNFYFKKKKIFRIRNIINKDNAIKYLIKINFDLKIYDKYLNYISIKYNKLMKKDIRKKLDCLFFFIIKFILSIKHL